MQFDREKMRAVILHACHSCKPEELGAVKLHKVFYFLDMIGYAHTRSPVTGATYRKRPNGPTAEQLLSTLRDMARNGDILIRDVDYHGYIKKEYVAQTALPAGVLNDQELSLLDDVIDFVCRKNTAKRISDISHMLPWELADMGDIIPYHTAMLLFPSEPTPEAFEISEQGIGEIAAARSSKQAVAMPLLSDFRSGLRSAAGQA